MKVFLDSDILIWHLRGMEAAKDLLQRLACEPDSDLWIGAMQRAEILFFVRREEEDKTTDLLSLFVTHSVDEHIIDQAARFFRRWNPSHGIDPNDAILAATVAVYGGRIVTQNVSHYPMPDISVQRGWPASSYPPQGG
jgi:predicted nucleic acid-binding protein